MQPVPKILTKQEFDDFCQIVVSNFDIESVRLRHKAELKKVLDYYLDLYEGCSYFTMFTPVVLERLSTEHWEDPIKRDFILNLTERVSFQCSHVGINADCEEFYGTIVGGICRTKQKPTEFSLVNKRIAESFAANQETILTAVKANFWYVVLYALLHNFHQTVVFQTHVKQETNPGGPRNTAR